VKIPPAVGIDRDFWAGRRVLLTGHTGFKGAWLSLWLQSLGAELTGLAPGPPTSPSLYELADVGSHMKEHARDVRDVGGVCGALAPPRPQVVLHLAAQPMVRRSLQQPALTYAVNVMGTVNVLEAVRVAAPDAQAVVVVTSDKCYEQLPGRFAGGAAGAASPLGLDRPFVEDDRLGGADPYSSSKACAELVSAAYRRTYFTAGEDGGQTGTRVASARAGNVIGGGDWGQDRLVADVARAVEGGEVLRVRSPAAVRPWQHVLNPLYGYMRLAEELSCGARAARAWNFGPPPGEARPVSWIVARLAELWQGALRWEVDDSRHPAEAAHLEIDSSAAQSELGWRPGWSLEEGLGALVDWHQTLREDRDMRAFSLEQIERFGHAIA
jgi:CDP-glucose 4,6-dehydratase